MKTWIKVLVYNKYQRLLELIMKVLSVARISYFLDFILNEINYIYAFYSIKYIIVFSKLYLTLEFWRAKWIHLLEILEWSNQQIILFEIWPPIYLNILDGW